MTKKLDKETIERDCFIYGIMIGKCPKCGSNNVHDCEARSPIIDNYNLGSDCEVAKKLNDHCVGHCDDSGYLWCLECGTKLSLKNPVLYMFI